MSAFFWHNANRSSVIRIGANLAMMAITALGSLLAVLHLDIPLNSVPGIIILGFLAYLFAERLIAIIDIFFQEKSLYETKGEFLLLKSAMLQGNFVIYTDNAKAFSECVELAQRDNVIWINNTVFRFGIDKVEVTYVTSYKKWISAKENLLGMGKRVDEIFDFNVPIIR
jgi:hypothetical protein